MPKFEDLTGRVFNRLTVIERAPNVGTRTAWRCRCECGNEIVVRGCNLKSGNTKSCKCFLREFTKNINFTHGKSKTPLYREWCAIKNRCDNPKFPQFDDYGGRNIKMCDEWKNSFEKFYEDVSRLPCFGEPNRTLDRIDNNKGYEPDNMRWATPAEQARNTSKNVKVVYNGEEMTLTDAAERSGLPYKTLHSRYHRGDRGERLFRPIRKN